MELDRIFSEEWNVEKIQYMASEMAQGPTTIPGDLIPLD